jgi:hypothetical protein
LGFVDNQDYGFSHTVALKEPVIELQELLTLRPGFADDVEFRQNEIKQLIGIHSGVEEEGRTRVAVVEPVQKTVDQGSFAGTHFTGERDKSFAGLNAVHQTGQGFLDLLRKIKEAWIGVDIKRIFFQPVEAFVHSSNSFATAYIVILRYFTCNMAVWRYGKIKGRVCH